MQVGKLLSIEKGKEEELFAEMDNDGKHNAYQDYALLLFTFASVKVEVTFRGTNFYSFSHKD